MHRADGDAAGQDVGAAAQARRPAPQTAADPAQLAALPDGRSGGPGDVQDLASAATEGSSVRVTAPVSTLTVHMRFAPAARSAPRSFLAAMLTGLSAHGGPAL